MVVASDRHYNTSQAVAFAEYCRQIGVDVLMVMPPDWAGSCTPETLAAHYTAVAEHIPVMLVTNVFIARGDEFGLQTLERTLAATANVVAIKDDMCGAFARKMALMAHDRCAILSGGQKQNHLDIHPYGCDGYLATFITFRPEISRRYWSAIERNDVPAATRVIRDFDLPFFNLVGSVKGGFDAGIHAVLEICGICQRWRRPPYYSLNNAELGLLEGAMRNTGLL